LRTLCLLCHRRQTLELRRRLAAPGSSLERQQGDLCAGAPGNRRRHD
jgi:hypothetical protein